MQDSQRTAALSAALRFVIAIDMPSQHKATLIEVLTHAMREESAAELRRHTVAQEQGEWRDHEIAHLKSFLQGRTATSWQHADQCVMHVAAQLRRAPDSVRTKAAQLGFGAAVDYQIAKRIKESGTD
jgi:hypothetical protein